MDQGFLVERLKRLTIHPILESTESPLVKAKPRSATRHEPPLDDRAEQLRLTNRDASIVLGMVARGDRDHDIAAWFGVNQGRIADVKDGKYGSVSAAPVHELPPKGPPSVKGRRLRSSIGQALEVFSDKGAQGLSEAIEVLKRGAERYDANEA